MNSGILKEASRRKSADGVGGATGPKVTYEPSVEAGKVFTQMAAIGGSQEEQFDPAESDPNTDSVSRGTRQSRSALVVVSESGNMAEASVCQFPGKKDQDRYSVQLSSDMNTFPHYIGLFDGHGTSVFAADLCAGGMLNRILECNTRQSQNLGGSDQMVQVRSAKIPSDNAIITAFRSIHNEVVDQVKKHPRTGTTAIALFVAAGDGEDGTENESTEDHVKVAWVGDSRAIMVSETGQVTQLTIDHSLSSNQKEAERIEAADHSPREGLLTSPGWLIEEQMAQERGVRARAGSYLGKRSVNGREAGPTVVFAHSGGVSLQVSRSIGDVLAARSVIPDPEITSVTIPKGQYCRFILASDGLWDVYTNEQAAKLIQDIYEPAIAARKLSLSARTKRTQTGRTMDDITVVIFDMYPKLLFLEKNKKSGSSSKRQSKKKSGDGGDAGGTGKAEKCIVM